MSAPETACTSPKGRHRWSGSVCSICGMTRGRLAAMYDDRNVAKRAIATERARIYAGIEAAKVYGYLTRPGEKPSPDNAMLHRAAILAIVEPPE